MCVLFLQDVDASEIKVQVCVYAFDLLYLNGEVRIKDKKYHPEISQNVVFTVVEPTCAPDADSVLECQ